MPLKLNKKKVQQFLYLKTRPIIILCNITQLTTTGNPFFRQLQPPESGSQLPSRHRRHRLSPATFPSRIRLFFTLNLIIFLLFFFLFTLHKLPPEQRSLRP
ncbi:hypothetical protein Hanom_Chr08g00739681 [Helianthus anomalus]